MKKVMLTAVLILLCCVCFNANAQHKIGDLMEKSGTWGIVVYVDDSGQHGLLMSCTVAPKKTPWASEQYASVQINTTDENDGKVNTQKVVDYAKNNGLNLADAFPLFNWAVNTCGEGWYIPAINELLTMAKGINGGTLKDFDPRRKPYQQFQKALMKPKGSKGMFTGDIIAQIPSSTEFNGKTDKVQGLVEVAQSLLSKKGNFQTLPAEKNKSQIIYSKRAFYKF